MHDCGFCPVIGARMIDFFSVGESIVADFAHIHERRQDNLENGNTLRCPVWNEQ